MRSRVSWVVAGCFWFAATASAQSNITARLDDPAAVYATTAEFGVKADGTADDSAGLQAAIDKAAGLGGGIVFVPSGRYRITRTIYVWRAVRVIGYGQTRPAIVLGPNTPGYQQGIGLMVMFSGGGPAAGGRGGRGPVPFPPPGQVPPNPTIPDANPGTFYPGMSNLDFEIGDGNPAAVAIRVHAAQHAVLTHMNFHVGSGLAGLTEIGNEAEDLHFFGGRYGILTDNTSPFWQFTLIDSTFDGQREAAIREHMAGLTLIRDTFRDVPIAVDLDPEYSDQLWIQDSRFEHVSNAVVVISNERNPQTEVGVVGAVCSATPTFVRFRESGKALSGPGAMYRVQRFNYGLFVPSDGRTGHLDTHFDASPLTSLPAPLAAAIRPLPPSDRWVNVRTLGVKGDGQTDDTAALQQAVATHDALYFPIGHYIVRDTITLGPDTAVIALHPGLTQLDLPDNTPGYQGVGAPKAVLQTPRGGTNVVSALGIYTGNVNPRAMGMLWMAGETSLADDVQFHGGAGGYLAPAVRAAFYSGGRGGGPGGAPVPAPVLGPAVPLARDGAQYPSLWITRGGGGTFAAVWSPDTHAQSGVYVSDTTTPGHVYQLSNEHHLFNEIKLDRVENWEFLAPQTEEEAPSSPEAVSFEIANSKNVTIANYHAYRVTRSHAPAPAAARVYNSSEIHFRNVHVNAESGYGTTDENGPGTVLRVSKFSYDNAIQDVTHHLDVRDREFAVFDLVASPVKTKAPDASAVVAAGAPLEKIEDGFYAISGATTDAAGTLYFVDRHQHRIYAWSAARGLRIVRHDPLDPVNLAADRSGALMVVSSAGPQGTVYSFHPDSPADQITVLEAHAAVAHPDGTATAFAANVWDNGEFANQLNFDTLRYTTLAEMFAKDVGSAKTREFVSPDGSLFLPMGRVFRQGPDDTYPGMDATGWRWSNNLDAYGVLTARTGQRVLVVSSAENRTYRATMNGDGTLGDLKPFAERGGESVAADRAGNVYVTNGQIFVYNQTGGLIAEIDVPDRPIQVLFGGPDRKTLFVLTHHALYAQKMKNAGDAPAFER